MTGIKKRLGSLLGPVGPAGTTAANARFDEIERKSDNAVTRVEHIETVAGLAPGEVTDVQTANLIQQPDSSTRSALGQTVAADLTTHGTPLQAALNARMRQSFHIHLVGLWGQSNMSGRGMEFNDMTDPENPRIFQVGSKDRTLRVASEPLDMHDTPQGIGPGLQFARHYLKTLPSNDVVVLVPSANGGTALSTDATPRGWRWGVEDNLAARAVQQLQDALTLVASQWPGNAATIDAILWLQGESDSSETNLVPGEVYQADLDALIEGVRSVFDIPDLPFIIGQMLPEAMGIGTRDEIDGVQRNTPYRVPHTGYSLSAPPGYSKGDQLHFNAPGQRINATNMFDEFLRVRSGLAPINPEYVPPLLPTEGPIVWQDSFTRADSDTLGTTETSGFVWSEVTSDGIGSTHGIRSNALAHVRGAPEGGSVISYVDTGVADGYFQGEIAVPHLLMRLAFRVVDVENFLCLVANRSSIQLRTYIDNSSTVLESFTLNVSSGVTVGVLMEGDQITVYANGDPIIGPVTVPEYTTSTLHGVMTADTEAATAGRMSEVEFRELVQD